MEAPQPRLLLITSAWPPARPRPVNPKPAGTLAPPASPVKREAEALQAAGLSVEIFAFAGRGFYNYAAAWTRLRPRLHPGRYDVVHAQETSNVLLALPKRVPLVVTVGKQDLRKLLQQLLARLLAGRADAVIVGSDEMRGRVRTRAPVHVIPPDLDEPARTARLVDVYRSIVPERFSAS
ncbi:MAG: glycosyltransferase family 4 protein [Gemmatimonadales bacterium]